MLRSIHNSVEQRAKDLLDKINDSARNRYGRAGGYPDADDGDAEGICG
jgi:hypothetical protein